MRCLEDFFIFFYENSKNCRKIEFMEQKNSGNSTMLLCLIVI